MSSEVLLEAKEIRFFYGERRALDGVSLTVRRGEIFGLLGPNGGGKTTLFKLLSTSRVLPEGQGEIFVDGKPLSTKREEVRRQLGVVFQAPALDKKLTVRENLVHHGHLYGLSGADLAQRINEGLEQLELTDRAGDIVEKLSGGLQRRVELAKALLHKPSLLILDEPGTGLDPGIRAEFWQLLEKLRRDRGMTVLVTTHLFDEAERCDRLAFLDSGKLIAEGTPVELCREVGGEVVKVRCTAPARLKELAAARTGLRVQEAGGELLVRAEEHAATGMRDLLQEILGDGSLGVESVTWSRPTLEDFYLKKTGRQWKETEA